MKTKVTLIGVIVTAVAFVASPVQAATISWTNWSPTFTTGTPIGGAASGTLASTSVSYSGELINLFFNYPSWGPAGTFNGGTVDNSPPSSGGIIQLTGGNTTINTLTFATAVVNPVLAIWSLGANGIPASFSFFQPFTIQSGGPSNEYGGSSVTTSDNLLLTGIEGNGTIQFLGTFTQLSWVNPQFESWYGFTVGIADVANTPIPATLPLFATGLAGLGFIAHRRKRRQAA